MTKKQSLILFCAIILLCSAYNPVYGADTVAGLGIIMGEPIGFSGKYWTSSNSAIDSAVAWSFVDEPHLHIHADWLHHNWSFLKDAFEVERGELPLYYGIGGRLRFEDESRAGIRFVVGASYIFEDAPFDIFFEIAPIMDLAPKTEVTGNASMGFRYWFGK